MAALHDTNCSTHPGCDLALYHRIRPVAYHNLTLHAHAGHDMTVLSVTVGRLVLIHEIHVDGVIGQFLIELSMEMQQGLTILL